MADLTKDEIRRIPEGADAHGWSERQSLILRACDGMVGNNLVDEQTMPDGNFTTLSGGVANPEDPRALTLAIRKAAGIA